MNQKKLAGIIKLLRENHVSHLKTHEFDITFDITPGSKSVYVAPDPEMDAEPPVAGGPKPALPVENNIPHHVNEVAKLLKMSDEDLVDQIFPVHGPDNPEGAV